ncbi:MAG: glycosyltransferase family 2 protein [Pseudomonadota bacterium]
MSGAAVNPLVSVITVVFNGATHLGNCLDSVRRQQGIAFEYIVIDGGSTDGSVELIRQQQHGLAYWVSEPDRGIGDAMNKGIARARGEWLLFLHADDYLVADDVLAGCHAVLQTLSADIVGFPLHFGSAAASRMLRPRGGGFWLNFKTGLLHQASFIRRTLLERIGPYDTDLRIAMDYEFFLRAQRRGACIVTRSSPVPSLMRDTGVSSRRDWPSLQQRLAEERAIHTLHANSRALQLLYTMYWTLYLPYRRLRALAKAA